MKSITKLYESSQNFLKDAEDARLEFAKIREEAKAYALSNTMPLKQFKKDPKFLALSKKMLDAQKLWYDYNIAAIIQAREEKIQSVLN